MLEKGHITVVRHSFSDSVGKTIMARGYNCVELYYGQNNKLFRRLRMGWRKAGLPFMSVWYNKKILHSPENIMVFDSICTPDYLKWLRKKKPSANINLWFWNIITHSMNPNTINDSWCRKWSFSRRDCLTYHMSFNPPPYFHEMVQEPIDMKYDLAFVGRDKGRLEAILKYKQIFEDMGLITKFVITPTNSMARNPNYSPTISYEESVMISASSKAVFDYIEVPDSGQSMRVLECLFQRKKVVTNSQLVVDYDFYNPNNIFVIGKDDIRTLPDFINSPYVDIPQEIINIYDFDAFIQRFFETGNEFDYMMKGLEDSIEEDNEQG